MDTMGKVEDEGRKIKRIVGIAKKLNLRAVDVDYLHTFLRPLLKGYAFSAPTWPVGQIFYRGRKMETRPLNIDEMSYPSVAQTDRFQRANRPGNPMFYCSVTRDPVFFELHPRLGDFIAISNWRTKKKMQAWSIGFEDKSFLKLNSARSVPPWVLETQSLVSKFFAAQFTRKVKLGDENSYKISVAIAEIICAQKWERDEQALADDVQIGGMHFPSVAMFANSDNFALQPAFVDQNLTLTFIEWLRIDEILPGPVYRTSRLDFSDTFLNDGTIMWSGHPPKTTISPGEQLLMCVENGQLMFRDSEMRLVGYKLDAVNQT